MNPREFQAGMERLSDSLCANGLMAHLALHVDNEHIGLGRPLKLVELADLSKTQPLVYSKALGRRLQRGLAHFKIATNCQRVGRHGRPEATTAKRRQGRSRIEPCHAAAGRFEDPTSRGQKRTDGGSQLTPEQNWGRMPSWRSSTTTKRGLP
jgi:hypothetical protein